MQAQIQIISQGATWKQESSVVILYSDVFHISATLYVCGREIFLVCSLPKN